MGKLSKGTLDWTPIWGVVEGRGGKKILPQDMQKDLKRISKGQAVKRKTSL